jgi:hypothetical protein
METSMSYRYELIFQPQELTAGFDELTGPEARATE